MNIVPPRLAGLAVILLIPCLALAQKDWQAKPTAYRLTDVEARHTPKKGNHPDIISSTRYHKRLPGTHSGIVIELTASNWPLERDTPIFRQFGNIYYHKLVGGGYSYLILTNFTTPESAQKFLDTVVKPKAPDARVLIYDKGKRTPFDF